jgi:hypothetical protein
MNQSILLKTRSEIRPRFFGGAGVVLFALIATFAIGARATFAQRRDHLTEQEAELVRDNQELDKRIEVFIKAADRRFAIINGLPQTTPKKVKKDDPDWGEPPKGTHAELLSDIADILDEATTNIDDVVRKDAKSSLLHKSLQKLATAANGYMNQLAILKDKTQNEDELAAIERAFDNAKEIAEAGGKLPANEPEPPAPDKKKKKP